MPADDFDYSKLSAELIDFAQYLEPTATEKRDRSYAFNEIKRTIEREIESSEVHAFGSYETGLLLPSSDIDMRVALGTELPPLHVKRLMQQLTKEFRRIGRRGLYHQVLFIPAKIPVIQLVVRSYRNDVSADISIANDTVSSTRTLQWLKEHKELKPIYLFLKFVLLRIQLADDPNYCLISAKTSGLAGYSLVCMIVHYIKYQAKRNEALNPKAPDYLGCLLMGILEFYGSFDYTAQALQFDDTEFFTKPDTSEWKHPHKFVIHDPDQPGVNVARSTTTMNRIQAVLCWIRQSLFKTDRRASSLIGPLVARSWRFGARNREEVYKDGRLSLTGQDIQLDITHAAKNHGQKRKRKQSDTEEDSRQANTNRAKKAKNWKPKQRQAMQPKQRQREQQRQSPSKQNNHANTKHRFTARKRPVSKYEKPKKYLYSRSLSNQQ